MADSSSSSHQILVRMKEDDVKNPRFCHCNLRALFIQEGTLAHPCRRFHVCANYFRPEIKCKYWVWFDEELSDHYKDMLRLQKKQERNLGEQIVDTVKRYRAQLEDKDKKIFALEEKLRRRSV